MSTPDPHAEDHVGCAEIVIAPGAHLDAVGELLRVAGAIWPGGHVYTGDPRQRGTVLHLPREHFGAEVPEPDTTARLEQIGEDEDGRATLTVSTPEEAGQAISAWAHLMLADSEAENYLEWTISGTDPDTGKPLRYVICVANSPSQTPHALRKAAEKKLAAVRAIVDSAEGHQVDEVLAALRTVL